MPSFSIAPGEVLGVVGESGAGKSVTGAAIIGLVEAPGRVHGEIELNGRRIDRLPDLYRTVFVLRAVEEMSVQEAAAALDLPEATVRTRFFRARSLLREGLSRDVDVAVVDAFAFASGRCDRIVAGVLARIASERESPRV